MSNESPLFLTKVECPVCGAYARDEGDLCSTARAVQGCLEESAWPTPTAGQGGGGLQARAGHRRPLSIHRATPSVEACARWAEPKASLTKMSHSAAILRASACQLASCVK